MAHSPTVLRAACYLASVFAACAAVGASACYSTGGHATTPGGGDGGGDGETDGAAPLPFYADTPNVYVAKVKNVLVGLAPTDDELKAVIADPTQLGALVDGWMQMPEYQTKMLRFFELSFQQTQIVEADFSNMLQPGQLQLDQNIATQPLMVQNQEEVFARTMLSLTASGQPFNQAMSTQTYMMTTAMRVFYALTDVWQLDNNIQGIHDYFQQQNPGLSLYVTAKTQIPLSQTLDPTSANFMHWYDAKAGGSGCDPIVYPARANSLYDILLGVLPKSGSCKSTGGDGQLTYTGASNDFNDWAMVTIRQPKSGESPTAFYDLQALRSAKELVLKRPYVGFFTTPAFFANWQTNMSNEHRVTINQTLIVATGAQIDGADPTVPMMMPPPGLDSAHAGSPACVTCHQLLDPTRSILSATFSWYEGMQLDSKWTSQPGYFIFQNWQKPVSTVYDLGNALATHPLVASGWAQKLCYYVDSEACEPTDPEFQRIVTLFQSSSFSWNALVKAIVTSPITTHTAKTVTATTNGEPVAVARRDHLCAALNARLGFADICGLDATKSNALSPNALAIIPGLPSDGYGRGSVAPVLPNDPSLFYRAGTENLCELIAPLLIDNKNPPPGATAWSSSNAAQAITEFVSIVAGLPPSDPRATPFAQTLTSHFTAAKSQSGITPTEALESTFMVACMAPSAISIGL